MVVGGDIMPMLTVKDVADLLNIHVNTVRRWSDQGILKAYRITSRGDRRFRRTRRWCQLPPSSSECRPSRAILSRPRPTVSRLRERLSRSAISR